MPGKNIIRFINSLKLKKFRREHQLFILEGEKIVDECISSTFSIHSLYATPQWLGERGKEEPTSKEFPVYKITQAELDRVSSLSSPNKVLALVRMPVYTLDLSGLGKSLTLVLDNVQDPGNLGTLIRSCDWFGIDDIICSEGTAEATNPKVIQSSMGSILRVRIHYRHLPGFLKMPALKGMPVLGAVAGGPDIYSMPLPERGLVVLGNESHGISGEVENLVTQRISIPNRTDRANAPESLNVAVAGSIIISEIRRRIN
jgi:RNA methyltransferase, TrmH family